MFAAGEAIAVEAQLLITEGSVSGKGHVPSRPGEPPQNDTGVLAGGIIVRQTAPLKVEIVSTAPYSNALEFGSSRMSPRPFMGPGSRIAEPEVNKIIARAARRAVRQLKAR